MDPASDLGIENWCVLLEARRRRVVRRDEVDGNWLGQSDPRADVRTFEECYGGQHAHTAGHRQQGDIDRRVTGGDTALRSALSIGLAMVHRAGVVVASGARAQLLDWPGAWSGHGGCGAAWLDSKGAGFA